METPEKNNVEDRGGRGERAEPRGGGTERKGRRVESTREGVSHKHRGRAAAGQGSAEPLTCQVACRLRLRDEQVVLLVFEGAPYRRLG